MQNKDSVCIVIPAFNEEECIVETVRAINRAGSYAIVVVDDGSTDKTGKMAREEGVHVISLPHNMGAGTAFYHGLVYAYTRNYEYVVQIDADGQHNPCDIEKLLHAIENNACDMVVGSRYLYPTGYKTPWYRWAGIQLLSFLVRSRLGYKIYDPTSGFRIINRETMHQVIPDPIQSIQETVMLAYVLASGHTVKEVSVEMYPRRAGSSKLTLLNGLRCLLLAAYSIISIRIRN